MTQIYGTFGPACAAQETLEAMRETEEIGNAPDRRGMPLDLALAELKR